MTRSTRALTSAFIFATIIFAAPIAHAIPALQLYSPDAVYDTNLETWVLTEGTFELWVVGDVGRVGSIYDVFLSGSVYGTSGNVNITLNGVELGVALPEDYEAAGGYDNITHHAEFANADGHQYWTIGDLTSTADAIQDYQPGSDPGTGTGTILKLMVSISGYEAVHFDAFDHYFTGGPNPNGRGSSYKEHYVFAPFSHDATGGGGGGEAPEPGSLWMLGIGLAGLVATARRKRNR
ncbi:MAG TPA: choice-of-anchor N protein [Candidatus Eisenbacteria bacterium]|nr:choice-of-anchor N protein [Candidatus Eisenbacteria bacterium]